MNTTNPLSEGERQALCDALDDENKAYATYARVIADFGQVRPFVNIVEAEARHFSALLALFESYDIKPPKDRWRNNAPRFSSLNAACAAAVEGEIENVALYDRVSRSTQRPDILSVYNALREASLDRHLPAFRRCVERENR